MSSLRVCAPPVKTSPLPCPACEGDGVVPGPDLEPWPCPECDGYGRVVREEPAPERVLLAMSGDELLELGARPEAFVAEMAAQVGPGCSHVAVWERSGDPFAPDYRLLAVVRPGPAAPVVTWL
jgi:hypothetical protein